MTATSTPPIAPTLGESEGDFVVRAHQELSGVIPEPSQRNRVIWDAWDLANGNPEKQRADQLFHASQYEKRPEVCYFSEHEANSTDPDGNPIVRKYDAGKLREIIEENNTRIADVDAYPTIVDRHTAPAGTRDPSPPDTLGVVGPLRLGMIGRINPRLAIFGDEYIRKDKLGKIAEKGGRSVEVLTQRSTGRSYLNPIAAISEAPRLPLPVQFSYGSEGDDIVDRYTAIAPYSMTAAAMPGGTNTFVPSTQTSKRDDQYGSASNSTETPMQGQDQLVRQVVDAVSNMPELQYIRKMMESGQGDQSPPQQPEQNMAPGLPPGMGGGMYAGGMSNPSMRYDANHDLQVERDVAEDPDSEQYAALVAGQQELIGELADTKSQLAAMQVERTDAQRTARIQELSGRVPVDTKAELDRCLYSAGSTMDDEAFERHIDTVEQYAAKAIEQMPMVPVGQMPAAQRTDQETAKYQADLSAMVRHIANENANAGKHVPYPEVKQEAARRLEARQ